MNQIWEDVKNLGHNEVVKNLIFDWFSFLETHEDISNYVKCKKVNKKKEQKEAQALHNQVIKEQKDTEKQDQKIYNQSLYHMLDGADNYKGVPSKGHQKGWIFDYVSILLRARFTGQLIKITVYSEIMYLIFYIIRGVPWDSHLEVFVIAVLFFFEMQQNRWISFLFYFCFKTLLSRAFSS